MKNFQPTAQLVADLEIIAAIMEKHNLDFYVSLYGDTHSLMTEFYLNVGQAGYKVNDDTYMEAEGLRLTVAMLREQVQRNLEAVDAAKLTANGTVKTFGVGGPNVLDMIGD